MRHDRRPLPRPTEDITDQGLPFDLGTTLTRRRMLGVLAAGMAATGLAACGTSSSGSTTGLRSESDTAGTDPSTTSTAAASSTTATSTSASGELAEIPEETAGPYPGDGSNGPNVLTDDGVIRSDIRSSFGGLQGTADGTPMTLELTIRDLADGGRPLPGAAVYAWHCDRRGRYSLYSQGATDQNYLRGVQVTDSTGLVRFTSIFPGCYAGRWPHIHFEVYPDSDSIDDAQNAIATSQVALPADVCEDVYRQADYSGSLSNFNGVSLAADNVFGDDRAARQLGEVTGSGSDGYLVRLTVGIDRSTPAGGGGSGPRPR
jgi:protocatechuate 3,4-dioxygenase beta subunit